MPRILTPSACLLFFHDGSAPTLRDVVLHYEATFALGLSSREVDDLVAYLQSI